MDRRSVQLQLGGQSYRVVSTAPEQDLRRLAETVTSKLAEVSPGARSAPPQAMLLAAMAFAHELESEKERRVTVEHRTRDLLRRALIRLDEALEPFDAADAGSGE